jgi:hypothetical protein
MKQHDPHTKSWMSMMFILFSVFAQGQNYSGLLNKDLSQDLSREYVIGGVLDILSSGGPSGNITKVKVIDDRETSATFSISFSGFQDGYIHVSLTDDKLQSLKGFTSQKISIEKDKKEVEAKLQFDLKSYAENETFEAPKLLIIVSKTESTAEGIRRVYKLNKKFTNPISPENIVIPISLTPVGSAASLPAQLPAAGGAHYKLALPRRNVYEVIKDKPVYIHRPLRTTEVSTPATGRTSAAETDRKVLVKPAITGTSVLHSSVYMRAITPATPSQPPPSIEPEGPENNPLSFWGDFIYSDVDFESQMKITSVNLNIYRDKNPNSGVFYYLPIAYDIRYDKQKGFAFNVDYGTSRSEGSESKVRMAGILTSGISLYEVQFIKNLMEAYQKQNPGLKLEKPLPLPVSETPVITLGDELKNFGITNVNINNVSSITDPIEFSWLTDGTTAAELENLLRVNSGITGRMKIKPQGGTLPVQEIPVRIRLIDENTFGRFGMTPAEFRNKNWRNETPYPIKLNYIHYMIIDKNRDGKESPIIYSWDLAEQEVQPKSQVKFDVATIPLWLDNHKGKPARIWLDYSVVNTCTSCNEQVFSSIISSTTRPQLSDVVFRMIDFFDSYQVAYMDVEMKSIQGDPSGRTETNFPIVHITKDKTDYVAGKIYIPNGSEPAFDYRITVVTKNGAEMKSTWIKRNSLNVPFGSYQLEELFPTLKP